MSDTSAFKGKKIAVMVASGFNEEQFLIIQKTILAAEGSSYYNFSRYWYDQWLGIREMGIILSC